MSFLLDPWTACAPFLRGYVGHDAGDVLAAAPPRCLICMGSAHVYEVTIDQECRLTARVAGSFLAHVVGCGLECVCVGKWEAECRCLCGGDVNSPWIVACTEDDNTGTQYVFIV